MDFSYHLFSCSSLGHLLTEAKAKADKDAGLLSESAKIHLIDVYAAAKYGRHNEIETLAMKKGTFMEEQAITLYSAYRKEMYRKNTEQLHNKFIKGTPDIRVKQRREVYDTKVCQDIFTFLRNLNTKVKQLYYWQLHGYMWLDEAANSRLAYCLVDTPEHLIDAEAARLKYKIPANQLEWAIEELRKQLTYNDIPYRERIIEQHVKRKESDITRIERAVNQGRLYLQTIEEQTKLRSLNTEIK